MRPVERGPPIVADEAAQREQREIAAAGEQHDQQHREQKARHRVADDDDRARPHIEARAVLDRLADAERDRHEIGEQRRPQPDRDRHRQAVLDQADDAAVLEKAVAEIEHQIVLHHQFEAFERRLVEPVLVNELGDQRRVDALRAAVFAVDIGLRRRDLGAAAGDPRGGADHVAFELGDHLLHRAARRRLHDDEIDHHDREQGRDHQQDAADRIGDHLLPVSSFFFASMACSALVSTHQVSRSSAYFGVTCGWWNLFQ